MPPDIITEVVISYGKTKTGKAGGGLLVLNAVTTRTITIKAWARRSCRAMNPHLIAAVFGEGAQEAAPEISGMWAG